MFPGHLSGVELLLQKDIFLSPYFFRLMQYMRQCGFCCKKQGEQTFGLLFDENFY